MNHLCVCVLCLKNGLRFAMNVIFLHLLFLAVSHHITFCLASHHPIIPSSPHPLLPQTLESKPYHKWVSSEVIRKVVKYKKLSMSGAINRHQSRCAKYCYYFRMIATFLFSHIGLCALVFGYSIIGAFTFKALEAPNERNNRLKMIQERNNVVEALWIITQNSSVLVQREWSKEASLQLNKFEEKLVNAVRQDGYDGIHFLLCCTFQKLIFNPILR